MYDSPGKTNSGGGMNIRHTSNPLPINPLVLLDTGAQVTCMQSTTFDQLKIPYEQLRQVNPSIAVKNCSPLKVIGLVSLNIDCFCYKANCQGFQPIPFHVVKGGRGEGGEGQKGF